MIKMKNQKTKYYILAIILLAISAVILLPNLITFSIEAITGQSAQKLETSSNELGATKEIKNILYVNKESGSTEYRNTQLAGIAYIPGRILFCVEHGAASWPKDPAPTISVATSQTYGSIESSSTKFYWPTYCDRHGGHRDFTYNGENTYPYLKCVNNHYDVVQNGAKYMPDAGYILTYPYINTVTLAKQTALWATGINIGKEPTEAEMKNSGGDALYTQAAQYKEYHDKTTENGTKYNTPDIKAEDKTEPKEITVKANNKEQTLTIGPLSIDYIYGAYYDVAFSGIADMYMIGYNSKGEVVKDRIDILKYVDNNGTAYTPEYFEPNENDGSYVDTSKQVYPRGQSAGEENFQLMIENPNANLPEDADESEYVSSVKIRVVFKWMSVTSANVCEMEGYYYTVNWNCNHTRHCHHSCNSRHCTHRCGGSCTDCNAYSWLTSTPLQDHVELLIGERKLFQKEIELNTGDDGIPLNITMDLGGKVWEDVPAGKESNTDGQYGENDRVIPNVKVTLYTEDGKIATLLSNAEGAKSDEQVMNRINPTYTDKNGDYLFKGLNSLKKYYVTFEYNGQVYLPTDYLKADGTEYSSTTEMVNLKLYNDSNKWQITSKGTEDSGERNDYNETFAEIGSSPKNYKSSDSLHTGELVGKYNESFSQYELMGFELNSKGNYQDTGIRLIDSFYQVEVEDGKIIETNKLQEGEISKAIKRFIKEKKKTPTQEDLKDIYADLVKEFAKNKKEQQEIWRKLQFIEDCKITSYTQAQDAKHDLYPVYDNFIINRTIDMEYETAQEARDYNYNLKTETIDGVIYRPIYDGQFYVSQGLWRRQEADVALRKDIAYAATRINGKTEVYKYNKRAQTTDAQKAELKRLREIYEADRSNIDAYNNYLKYKASIENSTYWEIQLRVQDYNNYYGTRYTRELYASDYKYRSAITNQSGKDLELYVTYRLTVRNVSQSIVTEIKEIVDYYDKDYTYIDDLSWVMYGDNAAVSIKQEDYYNTIAAYTSGRNFQGELRNKAENPDVSYGTNINKYGTVNGESTYGTETQQDMEEEYNSVYIRGLADQKLVSGEEAYVYLTFKVNADSKGPVILDEDDSLKENYAEINGYATYYGKNTELPNHQKKGTKDVAGLIDINSNPGNLCLDDINRKVDGRYEQNFENDTDRAKSIKVTIDNNDIRSINGTVWEDERTQTVSNSVIGDGVRQEDEIKIQGVNVELVEKLSEGKEYVWQTTKTNASGQYEFKEIIPGNYFVRFHYGDTDATVLTNANGGENTVSYNGQDFKSTVYQKDMKNNKELAGYNEEYYDIKASDAFGSNLSDAKDIWSRREAVNNYSNNNGKGATNHLAEVLASPYANSINSELIKELRDNTNMTAQTAIIVLEGEYNRTNTDGDNTASNGKDNYLYGNDVNGKYAVNYVDFGLTERPKAQLELSKKVTNVKLTLANGNLLMEATPTQGAQGLAWAPKNSAYNLNSKMKKGKYPEYYSNNHRYAYRAEVEDLVAKTFPSTYNGLIKIDMDDELMHGATIKVTYQLAVTNAGETDYEGQDFYYKGTNANKKVTTVANTVLDYVSNNLKYRADDNKDNGWNLVTDAISQEGLNSNLADSVKQYNTILKTNKLAEKLEPGQTTKAATLVLSQIITTDSNTDNRNYNNIAEITTISNSVGRRMAYSTQGNQNPTQVPAEVDSAKAETIIITPPTGIGEIITYVAIALGSLAILVVGIIFIKRKVLKK